jgi:hypothetical protein
LGKTRRLIPPFGQARNVFELAEAAGWTGSHGPKSVLKLSEINMEINDLRRKQMELRDTFHDRRFRRRPARGLIDSVISTEGNKGNEGFFVFVPFVAFCKKSFISFSFFVPLWRGRVVNLPHHGAIMSQAGKNEKPTVVI